VFPRILEYVDQSIPDLARGFERPHVITIAPDSPAAAEDPVHRLGESDREALDAPGKRAAVLRLDDEVKVIALHGELQDPEAATRSQYQAAAEGAEESIPAQRGQHTLGTQGHVRGVPGLVRRPSPVRDADLTSGRFAASSGAAATPSAGAKLELRGNVGHLIKAYITGI